MSFREINKLLLERGLEFCEEHLPGGEVLGDEYMCADLTGNTGRSCSVNLRTGRWADFAGDAKGGDLISLYASIYPMRMYDALRATKDWLKSWLDDGETLPETNSRSLPETKDNPLWWRSEKADKIWEYKDAAGRVVGQVKRWNATPERAKVIRPWLPDEEDYKWPDTSFRPLLYLDEILGSEGPVVLVGGEKCADAIRELNYVGATIMGGENAIRKADLSVLEDRDVILWPDNDATGEKWATKLTEALKQAEVSSVRLVAIPKDTPLKWDAADADADARAALLADALESKPVFSGLQLDKLGEFSQGEVPERSWLVRGTILRGKPSILFGPGGCGKSISMMDLCLKLTTADYYQGDATPELTTFLGNVPRSAAGPCIYITLEDDKQELHRRIFLLDPNNTREHAPFYVVPGLDIEGFDPALVKQKGRLATLTRLALHGIPKLIDRVIKEEGEPPKLLALDPAGDFLEGSEDDAAIVKPLMRYLREMASRYDIAIILIGHDPKGQKDADVVMTRGMRGSGAWTANARFAFGLWRPSYKQAERILASLGENVTPKNIERVICGRVMKANFETSLTGVRIFLQNPDNGLLEDRTTQAQDASSDAAIVRQQVFEGIRMAASVGMPLCHNGKNGVHENRIRFPDGVLRDSKGEYGRNKLREVAKELLDKGDIVSVAKWHCLSAVLDIPGGPVAKNDPGVTPINVWPSPYEVLGADE